MHRPTPPLCRLPSRLQTHSHCAMKCLDYSHTHAYIAPTARTERTPNTCSSCRLSYRSCLGTHNTIPLHSTFDLRPSTFYSTYVCELRATPQRNVCGDEPRTSHLVCDESQPRLERLLAARCLPNACDLCTLSLSPYCSTRGVIRSDAHPTIHGYWWQEMSGLQSADSRHRR